MSDLVMPRKLRFFVNLRAALVDAGVKEDVADKIASKITDDMWKDQDNLK